MKNGTIATRSITFMRSVTNLATRERSQDLGERLLVPFYFPHKFSLPLLWADNESSDVLHREESNGKTVNNR